MFRRLFPLFFLLTLLVAASCTHRSYSTSVLSQLALASHRSVAVLPFEVNLARLRADDIAAAARSLSDSSAWTREQRQQRRQLGYALQEQLLAQLLRRQGPPPHQVSYQTPAETNRRLAAAGITYENLPLQTMARLYEVLGVDAVLSGQTAIYQPIPNGLAVALFLLTDAQTLSGNQALTNLTIHDCRTGQLSWRFDHELTGKLDNSPPTLAKNLARNAWRGFPYKH